MQLAACCSLLDFFLIKLYFCHYWINNQDKRRGTRSGKDLEQRFKLKQYLTTCQGYISDLILEWETILSLDSDISAPLNELPLACCITLHVMALISDLLKLFFHYIKIIWLVFLFFLHASQTAPVYLSGNSWLEWAKMWLHPNLYISSGHEKYIPHSLVKYIVLINMK